ncbi:hypothetical protein AB0I55_14605 [Actinocatenispora sera]|uniref:hypothetical protein n=1 Tax=Actinocatenispora sera TaxID=390989 RepID=UPI003408D8E9
MKDKGWEFGIDLGELMSIGRIQLPHLASSFAVANRAVARTAQHDQQMFVVGMVPAGLEHSMQETHRLFTELRDIVQEAMGHTAVALEHSGRVIVHVANAYADRDGEAEATMKNFLKDDPTYGLASGDTADPKVPDVSVVGSEAT